jgi:phage terminase Nu1 subunit (DNA packaging protein)
MNTTQPEPAKTSTQTRDDRLWTADDLASYIGCSVREIRNLRYAGLPTIKFRHLIRFEPEAVKAWLREPRP